MAKRIVHHTDENDEDAHELTVEFYRERMDSQPLHSALKSFNVDTTAHASGVYEIYRRGKVRRTKLWSYYQFSLPHLYIYL